MSYIQKRLTHRVIGENFKEKEFTIFPEKAIKKSL